MVGMHPGRRWEIMLGHGLTLGLTLPVGHEFGGRRHVKTTSRLGWKNVRDKIYRSVIAVVWGRSYVDKENELAARMGIAQQIGCSLVPDRVPP